jgi:hypothetical protein
VHLQADGPLSNLTPPGGGVYFVGLLKEPGRFVE